MAIVISDQFPHSKLHESQNQCTTCARVLFCLYKLTVSVLDFKYDNFTKNSTMLLLFLWNLSKWQYLVLEYHINVIDFHQAAAMTHLEKKVPEYFQGNMTISWFY